MARRTFPQVQDDQAVVTVRRDVSGGMNNRMHGTVIAENQVESITNGDIGVPGKVLKRAGINLIEDLGNTAGTGGFGFEPDGGTNELMVTHGTKLEGVTSPLETGAGGQFTEWDTGFTTGLQTTLFQGRDNTGASLLFIANGTDNLHQMNTSHTVTDLSSGGNTNPPVSSIATFFRGRIWIYKDGFLYWSDAYSSDYSTAFDQASNAYKVDAGNGKAIIGLRDTGLLILGDQRVLGVNPSVTPAATDKVEKLLGIGTVAAKSAIQVGDDVYFLASDGVRGVFRTIQDKVQLGRSEALSYSLKDEYDSINWAQVSKATAVWFDNKYLIALPVDGSTYNNEVWVYYPAQRAWAVYAGWEVGDWVKVTISGQERLYYIEANDGKVHRAFVDTDDNGTAISYTEVGRKEDLGQPLNKKVGGEVLIKALATGGTLTVAAAFDDGSFQTLGTMSLAGNLIDLTGTVTFPITFLPENVSSKKFHLDSYGSWYYVQLKLTHSDTDDAQILERTIVSFLEEYIAEETV